VDLRKSHEDLTGKEAERALELAGMTMNKNTVPGETRSPFVTSGLRIGVSAVTTRGLREADMRQIADWIVTVLADPTDEDKISGVCGGIGEMCQAFPLYEELAARV